MRVRKVIKKIKEGTIQDSFESIVWIYNQTKKYRLQIIGYLMLSFITVGCGMYSSIFIKDIVDYLNSDNMDGIGYSVAWYLGMCILNIIATMGLRRAANVVGYKVYNENMMEVYDKILVSDWEKMSKHHSGDLISRLSKDVDMISSCVVSWIPELISYCLQIIVAIAIIAYYDFSILLVFVVCAPVVMLGTKLFWRKMYESNQKTRKVDSELISFEKESFHNIQAIKAFDLTDVFSERMRTIQKKVVAAGLEFNKYSIFSWAIMYLSGQVAAMVCAGWAVYHVYTGVITLGTMTLLGILATYVATAFKNLINILPNAMSTVSSAERVKNLFEIPIEKKDNVEHCEEIYKKSEIVGASLEINDMSFSYDQGRLIFDRVSLYAKPNEIIALVGPSGEGKTTLLRIILGIVSTATGDNFVYPGEDKNDRMILGPTTRRMIAYVPQGNTMMSGTIADNMRLLNENATDDDIYEALRNACAYEFVMKLPDGIHHEIGESGIGFSEGQNQRLSIARALLCKAPILLLDEATSALDVMTERKVLNNMMEASNGMRTCILTTHRPSVLSKCDRVYRIADSKVRQVNQDEIHQLMNDF